MVNTAVKRFVQDYDQLVDNFPVAADAVISAGDALEITSGYVARAAGAGVFVGFAQEDINNTGGANGALRVNVYSRGAVDLVIATDTPAVTHIGVSATTIEATDHETFRIETGSAITGQTVGKPVGFDGQIMRVRFKGQHLP